MTSETPNKLSLSRFEELLDQHGSDATGWPATERDAAQALLTMSAEARSLQQRAAETDQRLSQWQSPEASPGFRRRLLADFAAQQPAPSWLGLLMRQLGGARLAMPAMAAAMVLGIMVGNWLPMEGSSVDDVASDDALSLLQYDPGEEGEW